MKDRRENAGVHLHCRGFRRGPATAGTGRLALSAAALLGATALSSAAWADPAAAPDATAAAAPAASSPADVASAAGAAAVNADAGSDGYTVDAVNKQLGSNPVERFLRYYAVEWGKAGPPTDPNAPPSAKPGWPAMPQSTPPMPFTDWPYGGATLIGDNRTASVDSPLMVALAPTPVGEALAKTGVQAYGWVDVGGNLSTSSVRAGNMPAAYLYNPNTIQMDQAVLYVERTPDTVQTDHVDWGFRLSAIYGTDYHYTTAYGVASYQLLKHNKLYGYDFPMMYGEIYVPQILDGLMIRVGRYISVPDIEAQLAPNNYMYTHSITYTFDNYTNEGVQTTLAVNKNVMLQLGVSVGTEAAVWHVGKKMPNPFPNPLYPESTMFVDPGAMPSFTACARFQTTSGHDNVYLCANGINKGTWGYNNLQWYGATYYHKFNDKFHVSVETYTEHQDGVANLNNPIAVQAIANGGTPFSPQYMPFNAPGGAFCKDASALRCRAEAIGFLTYWNYQPTPLDNVSLRAEWYDDKQGQRTGVKAIYYETGLGWQHWLSPQIELRPEVTKYWASAPAFNGDVYDGIPPNKKRETVLSGDVIIHF